LDDETVWLTQAQMVKLFQKSKQNVSLHIRNIFAEGELDEGSVVKEYLTTAKDGKKYKTNHYNLDVIISVGYRVKSHRGTQFRIWATQQLREYLIKGFVINDERLEELELKRLELLAEQFLSYAELQIVEKRVMYMNDWIEKLDNFLIFNEKEILHGAGSVSRKEMEDKVKAELKMFFDLKDNKKLSSDKGDIPSLPSKKNGFNGV